MIEYQAHSEIVLILFKQTLAKEKKCTLSPLHYDNIIGQASRGTPAQTANSSRQGEKDFDNIVYFLMILLKGFFSANLVFVSLSLMKMEVQLSINFINNLMIRLESRLKKLLRRT